MSKSQKINSAKSMTDAIQVVIGNMRTKSDQFIAVGVVPTFSASDEITLKSQLDSAKDLLDQAESAPSKREGIFLTQVKNTLSGLAMMLTHEDTELAMAISQHVKDVNYQVLAKQREQVHTEIIEGLKLATAIIAIL